MERGIQRAAFRVPGWAVVVGISAGLILARLEFAPVLVPFALALLAGVAKSGTA